ncbi:MAG: hypothetical protein H8D97_01825 [Proteobacteria bacterium]|nr:hypothetical protein [Pseudomonadota bacterium]
MSRKDNENMVNNVDEFVASAVLEGVAGAPAAFMIQLEEALRMDVIISNSGSVDNYLQEMIEDQQQQDEDDSEE